MPLNIAKKIINKITDGYIVDGVITFVGKDEEVLYSEKLDSGVLLNVTRRKVIK